MTETKKIELEDGRNIYYCSSRGVVRITVRGMYAPTEKRDSRFIYQEYAEKMSACAQRFISSAIELEYGNNIVLTDPTTTGISSVGSGRKYAYTVYVHPKEENRYDTAMNAQATAQKELEKAMAKYGFATVKQRPKYSGGKKKNNTTT